MNAFKHICTSVVVFQPHVVVCCLHCLEPIYSCLGTLVLTGRSLRNLHNNTRTAPDMTKHEQGHDSGSVRNTSQ